jgi:quinol monooxygenase YgiN
MVRGSVRPVDLRHLRRLPDDAAREAHLGGAVGKALAAKADELFASPPEISNLDVLANKL